MSKLFDRFDAKRDGLSAFIEWCCQTIKSKTDPKSDLPARAIYAVLRVLGLMFKHGARKDFIPYAPQVFDTVIALDFLSSPDILIRKLYCKLLQRLCLIFLQRTVQKWRYQRGRRVLVNAKAEQTQTTNANQREEEGQQQQEQEDQVSTGVEPMALPYLEKTIAQLIAALGDKDGVVRWSAAKGLARNCARLPAQMAEQVISTVIGMISDRLSAGGWHGAALFVAEFARRGLLKEQLLGKVVPIVSKAIFFDEVQGTYSMGSNVRDAACYVCWAFARAYKPTDLAPFVNCLATDLVIAMLFDREIQVRRAAAAAFQENVGRQGTFHCGIDILAICDYFAVGSVKNCYLDLAIQVAQLGDQKYRESCIDHLVDEKIGHWDVEIRELAAESFAALLDLDNDNEQVLDLLTSLLNELIIVEDVNRAHGLLLSLSESFLRLKLFNDECYSGFDAQMSEFFNGLDQRNICKGIRGEAVRQAVCHFISSISRSKINVSSPLLSKWLEILSNYLREFDLTLHEHTALALRSVLSRAATIADSKKMVDDSISTWFDEANNATFFENRSGFLKAIANMPESTIKERILQVVELLVTCCSITENTILWTESRVSSLKAITAVFEAHLFNASNHQMDGQGEMIEKLLDSSLSCLDDYTSDQRGDVASSVREQAGLTLMTSLMIMAKDGLIESFVKPHQLTHTIALLAGQGCGKIARSRLHAIHCLIELVRFDQPAIEQIPFRHELLDTFDKLPLPPPASALKPTQPEWNEKVTFERFSKFLEFDPYKKQVLCGLLLSCGDLTESLSKCSFDALSIYLRKCSADENRVIFNTICQLLVDCQKDTKTMGRLATPIVKALDSLVTGGSFDDILELQSVDSEDQWLKTLYQILSTFSRTKNIQRAMALGRLLCSLLGLPLGLPLNQHPASSLIVKLLVHPYPKVRIQTASALFEAISLSPPEYCDYDSLCTLLSESDWSDLKKAQDAQLQVCKITQVSHFKILKN